MALFPKCGFQVLVPDGLVVPGTTLDGVLKRLDAPEAIPARGARPARLHQQGLGWLRLGKEPEGGAAHHVPRAAQHRSEGRRAPCRKASLPVPGRGARVASSRLRRQRLRDRACHRDAPRRRLGDRSGREGDAAHRAAAPGGHAREPDHALSPALSPDHRARGEPGVLGHRSRRAADRADRASKAATPFRSTP